MTTQVISLTSMQTSAAEMVELFRAQAQDEASALARAIDRGDAARIHELAHRLERSSVTAGARGIAAVCDRIERALREAHFTDLYSARDELVRVVRLTDAQLESRAPATS